MDGEHLVHDEHGINQVLTFFPANFTVSNYIKIFTDPQWQRSFLQTISYVLLNVAISLVVSIPAAYVFSRRNFKAKPHLFFWLLTNRMAPAAAFLVPFFILFSELNLMDTVIGVALAHCLFNVPLSIWILEGFMSGVPKQIDETAFVDGYGFFRFFFKIFYPLISQGVTVSAFFCIHILLG